MKRGTPPALLAGDDDRMRARRVFDDIRGEPFGIVGTEDRCVGIGERKVDERLVPGCLDRLGRGASRPDRLADEPDVSAKVLVEEGADARDDPGRVATELGHVRELDRAPRAELLADEVEPGSRHGHQHRLVRAEAGGDELSDALDVLGQVAVEERLMDEPAVLV